MQMMNEREAIETVVREHLEVIAGADKTLAGYAVNPVVAPVPDPNGQMKMDIAWIVIVTLANPLLGQPRIAKGTPVSGGRPPDVTLKMATSKMLEFCRQDRDKLTSPMGEVPDLLEKPHV